MSSRFPILLWWGPELAMIYNDGYAPMHAPRCSACCAASSRSSSSRIVRASRRGARTSRSFGKPLLEALPELVDQPFPELLRQVRRTGEPVRTKSMVARLARTPGGPLEDLHLDFVYEPILCPEGNVDAILVFAVDVTTQVLAKKVVEHALDDAHRANEAKDQFLALLGHELRNPMAPILTALEIMKLRDDRNVGEQREIISRQARHLVRLIDDLLDVSRIARGRVELARERVAIAESRTGSRSRARCSSGASTASRSTSPTGCSSTPTAGASPRCCRTS